MNEIFLKGILDEREKRYGIQMSFIEKYSSPIISFMLNIPGEIKKTKKYVDFHLKIIAKIKKLFEEENIKINEEIYSDSEFGMYYIASVETDAKFLKQKMMEIENESFGRIIDIDVFDENKNQITRKSLGLPERKCILCENDARICIKEKNHSTEELLEKVNEVIDKNLNFEII